MKYWDFFFFFPLLVRFEVAHRREYKVFGWFGRRVSEATKSQPDALARDSAGNHATNARFRSTPFVPQGRSTRRLPHSRQGQRSLATQSLANASGCDGGTLRVLPLNIDAPAHPQPLSPKRGEGSGYLKAQRELGRQSGVRRGQAPIGRKDLTTLFLSLVILPLLIAFLSPSLSYGQVQRSVEEKVTPETPLYQQAIERFKGPSRIYFADSDKTGLDRWSSPKSTIETSVILDWNDKELVVIRRDGHDKTVIPAARVVRIEPLWENELVESLHLDFVEGRFQEAISKGTKILGSNAEVSSTPRWQQRLAIAELIESSVALGRWERGTLLYLSLAKSQSPPLLLASIPVPWSTSSAEIRDRFKIQEMARGWIQEPRESLQLLGAAWLIDTDQRSDAVRVLNQLVRNAEERWVKVYAEAQLWRTFAPNEMHSERLFQWTSLRDSLPLPYQAGPTSLLADKLQGAGNERALEEWMRVVLLHPERPYLFSRAHSASVALLGTAGRKGEAGIVERFKRDGNGRAQALR